MNELVRYAWSMAEAVGTHMVGVSPTLLVAGLGLHTLKLAARARAWQNVLRASLPETAVRFRDAAVPYLAGLGVAAVIPLGGGEVLRVALVRTRLRSGDEGGGGASTATIVGSLAVERVLDVAVSALVVALALTVGLLPNGALHGRLAGLGALSTHAAVAGLAGVGIGLAAAAGGRRFRRRLAAGARGVLSGLAVLGRPTRYARAVASWQLLSWLLRIAALVLFLNAFHVPAAAAVAPVVLSLQLLAGSVPLTPGGAGVQQALVAAALGSGAIVGFSAGAQAATMLVDLLLGLGALATCGVRPQLRIRRAAPA